jgi:RNA polymerase sigma factor for flagellar operon FliA
MSAQPSYLPNMPNTRINETHLIRDHGELVKRIAHHVAARLPPSVDVDDLIQAGAVGLIEAARHYSGERGASFETYAGIRIRGAIMDELRRGDWAPRSVHRRHREISGAIRQIEQRTGREAREEEIVGELGLTLDEYHHALQDAVQCRVLSIDMPREDGEAAFDMPDETAEPSRAVEKAEFQECLSEAIRELPERERLVLSLYYDEEINLREIGAVLHVTESRVCQIHGQALLRLRARLAEWASLVRA